MESFYEKLSIKKKYLESVEIRANELSALVDQDIDHFLLQKIKKKTEGYCKKDGLILPESLTILQRTLPFAPNEQFEGFFVVDLHYSVQVFNPPVDAVVPITIQKKNKMGVLGYINVSEVPDLHQNVHRHFALYPCNALFPFEIHNDEEDRVYLQNIEIGSTISAALKAKKFQIPDRTISFIAKYSRL